MQQIWVLFLVWEDPLEKEMAIQSSTLAWKIQWMEEPDNTVHGVADTTERLQFQFPPGKSRLKV